jgi:hypothetical protein
MRRIRMILSSDVVIWLCLFLSFTSFLCIFAYIAGHIWMWATRTAP